MPNYQNFFFITACAFTLSCTPDNPTHAVPADSTPGKNDLQKIGTSDTSTVSAQAAGATGNDTTCRFLQEWQKQMRTIDSNFSLSKFYVAGMQDIHLYDCHDWTGYDMDEPASPDSLWSAYTVPGFAGGEPDTYVYLSNLKRRETCTLDAAGSFSSFEDCGWMDDHTLIVVGFDTYTTEEKYPGQNLVAGYYIVYDLHKWSALVYSSKNYFHWR